MKWFKKDKARRRASELVKLADKTIRSSEDFLRVVENPNATQEEIEAAIKAAKEASQLADRTLEEIDKKNKK